MYSPDPIRVDPGEVTRITLNRPGVRNAFNDEMIRALREAVTAVRDDEAVRCVVMTGEGTAFCAGADLDWMRKAADFSHEESLQDSMQLAHLMRELYELPKPLVCRVNGPAIGGGTGLVAVADIALAARSAVLSFSEVRIGLVPAVISPYVIKKVGERWSREYFLTGQRLSAEQAEQCGLINRVVDDEQLDETVGAYVDTFLKAGPRALAVCKRMIRDVGGMSLDAALPHTAQIITELRMSEEGQEGMRAFFERRRPAWASGR